MLLRVFNVVVGCVVVCVRCGSCLCLLLMLLMTMLMVLMLLFVYAFVNSCAVGYRCC